jgi:hypothetical protein
VLDVDRSVIEKMEEMKVAEVESASSGAAVGVVLSTRG